MFDKEKFINTKLYKTLHRELVIALEDNNFSNIKIFADVISNLYYSTRNNRNNFSQDLYIEFIEHFRIYKPLLDNYLLEHNITIGD